MLRKELLDLARNRAALVPVVIATVVSLLIPFLVIIILPAMTGRSLSGDPALDLASRSGGLSDVPADIRVPAFLFQQFLMLFMLTPITGAPVSGLPCSQVPLSELGARRGAASPKPCTTGTGD